MRGMLLIALLALAGCSADSPALPAKLSAAGYIRPHIDFANPRRLVVEVANLRELAWNLDSKADRHAILISAMAPQCGAPSIVEERVTQIGPEALAHVPKIYTLVLDCPNGASQAVR